MCRGLWRRRRDLGRIGKGDEQTITISYKDLNKAVKKKMLGGEPSMTATATEILMRAATKQIDQDLVNYINQCMYGVPPNRSGILTGITAPDYSPLDEESRFERDWRSQMPQSWKGWSQSDINKNFAKIWIDEGKGVLCARFPYHQKAIDEFREKIPKGKKAWNADDKLWVFSFETIDVVVDILTRNFDEVIDMTQAIPTTSVVMSGDPLLSLLDKEDINKIYILLVKKYHPDIGGDEKKMARINQIFSQIK